MRFQFDRLAPQWDSLRSSDTAYAPYEAALEQVEPPPKRALDLGTGTGGAAFAIARRFPQAEVIGVDLAKRMIELARAVDGRLRGRSGSRSPTPCPTPACRSTRRAQLDPFFDELDRVLAPGGFLIVAFSGGAGTPIYVPTERLKAELAKRGFADFAEFSTDPGTALLARKGART
jgi:ubiquinone/menaquinone biosynthesis C-methylase UbiE